MNHDNFVLRQTFTGGVIIDTSARRLRTDWRHVGRGAPLSEGTAQLPALAPNSHQVAQGQALRTAGRPTMPLTGAPHLPRCAFMGWERWMYGGLRCGLSARIRRWRAVARRRLTPLLNYAALEPVLVAIHVDRSGRPVEHAGGVAGQQGDLADHVGAIGDELETARGRSGRRRLGPLDEFRRKEEAIVGVGDSQAEPPRLAEHTLGKQWHPHPGVRVQPVLGQSAIAAPPTTKIEAARPRRRRWLSSSGNLSGAAVEMVKS